MKLKEKIKKISAVLLAVALLSTTVNFGWMTEKSVHADVVGELSYTLKTDAEGEYYSVSPKSASIRGEDGVLTIPGEYDGKPVKEFTQGPAYSGYSAINSVILPNSVTTLSNYAFCGWTNLKTINLSSVTDMGSHTFEDCASLESITLNDALKTIGVQSFNNCTKLQQITIPETLESIGDEAFLNCESLESFYIPENVKAFKAGILSGCTSIETINVNENNANYISKDGVIFTKQQNQEKTNLVYFPAKKNIEEYVISEDIKEIEPWAFRSVAYLKKVEIPSTVIEIGRGAFENASIESVVMKGDKTDANCTLNIEIFKNCENLKKVELSGRIEMLTSGIFEGCTSLESLEIPEGVTTIQPNICGDAAKNCYLKEVKLPDSLTEMYYTAFQAKGELRVYTTVEGTVVNDSSGTLKTFSECANMPAFDGKTFISNDISKADKFTVNQGKTTLDLLSESSDLGVTIRQAESQSSSLASDKFTVTLDSTPTMGEGNEATVTGIGMYKGTKILNYTLTKVAAESNQATLSETTFTYDGSEHKPTIATMTDRKGNTISKDEYDVSYEGNVNAGTGKVIIAFKDSSNYEGTMNIPFTISKIGASGYHASLSASTYTYNGKTQTPSVIIGNQTLVKGRDYDVVYGSGRKNVGTYAVRIIYKGNYSGSKTLSFKINPKATSISKLTKAKKAFTAKWKKISSQVTGYQVRYSTSSKFKGAKTTTIKGYKKTSKTIKKLKKKKKYYVQVRTYKKVGNITYVSAWSKTKTVKTK